MILSSVKAIIFDFGGVICDIDIRLTVEKFREFGPPKDGIRTTTEESEKEFDRLTEALETGKISPDRFRQAIRDHYQRTLSDRDVDDAWNALLLDIPEHRIRMLEQIRNTYRIFLLSNSNRIHYDCYAKRFSERFGYPDFDSLFEKAWFSFRIGLKKPDPEIFKFVLSQHGLAPGETLFIDDTLEHIQSAKSLGINTYHLKPGEDAGSLFL